MNVELESILLYWSLDIENPLDDETKKTNQVLIKEALIEAYNAGKNGQPLENPE